MSAMYPCDLLFSQTSISSTLTRGASIPELIDDIARGYRKVDSDWLPLDVARDRYDGKLYCQDNRRLYIFRVLQRRGRISQIPVTLNIFAML